jgi:hypothetical protein
MDLPGNSRQLEVLLHLFGSGAAVVLQEATAREPFEIPNIESQSIWLLPAFWERIPGTVCIFTNMCMHRVPANGGIAN